MTYDTNYADSPLNHATLHAAMTVPAHGQNVGRAILDGTVVVYALDHAPDWLLGLIEAANEADEVAA